MTLNAKYMVEETKQESKKEEETSTQKSSAEEKNSDNSKVEEDDSKKPEVSEEKPKEKSGVDYEEQLRIAQESLSKAEKKIVKMKKDKKDDDFEEEEEEEDDRFSQLENKLDTVLTTLTKGSSKDVIDKYASSEAESKLIQFHLDNSIKLSGDLEADVRRAKAIANESRLIETNKELANAVQQKSNVSTGESSSHKTEKQKTVSGLSERDINHLKSRGLWEKYVEEHGE